MRLGDVMPFAAARSRSRGMRHGPFGLNDLDFSGVPPRTRFLRRSLRRPEAGGPAFGARCR